MDIRTIEHKHKDVPPEQTVETIRGILKELGMVPEESLSDSGLDTCYSLQIKLPNGHPIFSNGKGVTEDLARASAYAEFIERLQCGLFFYKLQSFNKNKTCDLQTFAPDKKYMTMQELEETGDWMDILIETYGNGLTRKKLVKLFQIYACTKEDKILTIPYYSLFEDKYVYMPAAFVEHIYASNGCCAGNSRDEAWVHAFSEVMERHCGIKAMLSGKAAPNITEKIKETVPMAKRFYDAIEKIDKYDVQQFDVSIDPGYPVICTRVINKDTHKYIVNFAADPVFEIAVSRSLTELMQGRKLDNINSIHDGTILSNINDMPLISNLVNQLETGNGTFAAGFFAEELGCDRAAAEYVDNTQKSNSELLKYCIEIYRKLGKPVYIRNCSFLGFHSYHFVLPGFSEAKWAHFTERIPEYAIGNEAAKCMRDPLAATPEDLSLLLAYHKKTRALLSRRANFAFLSGVPISNDVHSPILWVTLAYAAYRLGRTQDAITYTDLAAQAGEKEKTYFRCVHQYLTLSAQKLPEQTLRVILNKFNRKQDVDRLYDCLAKGQTPYDAYLLKCDGTSCASCYYRELCSLDKLNTYLEPVGKRYAAFVHGQDRSVFAID